MSRWLLHRGPYSCSGKVLRARTSVIHPGKRQAVYRCEVFAVDEDHSEKLCAIAQGTIVAVATEEPGNTG